MVGNLLDFEGSSMIKWYCGVIRESYLMGRDILNSLNTLNSKTLCITCGETADTELAYGPPVCYACSIEENLIELDGITQYLGEYDD